MSLEVNNVTVRVAGKTLLDTVDLTIEPGQVVTVLGPNGAGKSTLIKAITGEQPLSGGTVLLNGRKNRNLREQALMLGVLPQSSSLNFPFTVEEVVLLGRTPCNSSRRNNLAIVGQVLTTVDAIHLRHQDYTTLSGGERQRVHMARVLAQVWDECPVGHRYLLLDEPTAALDPAHQQLTLNIARRQADEKGVGVLVILHDLNLAARYSDQLVILRHGRVVAKGTPEKVLTPEIVYSVSLMLIGILAPMLGLLGTVVGLIEMFRNIAAVQGPVTPDVLADGLWVAMFTTAFGLIVAIPSLAAAHGFGVWANHYMARLEFAMNHANLLLEGLQMNEHGLADDTDSTACAEAVPA